MSSASYYLLPQQVKCLGVFLRESRRQTGVPARSEDRHPVLVWLLAEQQNPQAPTLG